MYSCELQREAAAAARAARQGCHRTPPPKLMIFGFKLRRIPLDPRGFRSDPPLDSRGSAQILESSQFNFFFVIFLPLKYFTTENCVLITVKAYGM
jgi:hypothetical protein